MKLWKGCNSVHATWNLYFSQKAHFSLKTWTVECHWAEITQLNVTGFNIASLNSIDLRSLFFPVMLNEEKCSRPRPRLRPNSWGEYFCIVAGWGHNFVLKPCPKFGFKAGPRQNYCFGPRPWGTKNHIWKTCNLGKWPWRSLKVIGSCAIR